MWGTLLVIPVNESLLYVRPLYLRAAEGRIPELKRVIVAYQNRIVMKETLTQGLAEIFGASVHRGAVTGSAGGAARGGHRPRNRRRPCSRRDGWRAAGSHRADDGRADCRDARALRAARDEALRQGNLVLYAEEMKKARGRARQDGKD